MDSAQMTWKSRQSGVLSHAIHPDTVVAACGEYLGGVALREELARQRRCGPCEQAVAIADARADDDSTEHEINDAYYRGMRDGIRKHAWSKDGQSMVGDGSLTFAEAIARVKDLEDRERAGGK